MVPALTGFRQLQRTEHVFDRVAQPLGRAPRDLEVALNVVKRQPAPGPLQAQRQPYDVRGPFVSHSQPPPVLPR